MASELSANRFEQPAARKRAGMQRRSSTLGSPPCPYCSRPAPEKAASALFRGPADEDAGHHVLRVDAVRIGPVIAIPHRRDDTVPHADVDEQP